MAGKQQVPQGGPGGVRGGRARGGGTARAGKPPAEKRVNSTPREAHDTPAPDAAGSRLAPGLDAARHAAAQRSAHAAELLHDRVFPVMMAAALGLNPRIDAEAYKLFLDRTLEEAGNPTDPIERLLIEQICLAHLRVGQLHVGAQTAQGVEATKVYCAAAARLLGEMRRTALAVRAYRSRVPEGKSDVKLKIFKMAQ